MNKLTAAITLLVSTQLLPGCDALLPLLADRNRDCTVTAEEKAPIFRVDAPATASVGVAFAVVPWVYRSAGTYPRGDELLPETFAAAVDTVSRTITLTGKIRRTNVRPDSYCPVPTMAIVPSAATLSVTVTAVATGTYTVRIPQDHFTEQVPPLLGLPSEPPGGYPAARATTSVEIR